MGVEVSDRARLAVRHACECRRSNPAREVGELIPVRVKASSLLPPHPSRPESRSFPDMHPVLSGLLISRVLLLGKRPNLYGARGCATALAWPARLPCGNRLNPQCADATYLTRE